MKISELFVPKKTEMCIRQLCGSKEAQKRIRSLGSKKAVVFFTTIGLSAAVSVPFFISDAVRSSKPVRMIERNEPGNGSKTASVRFRTSNGFEDEITVDVSERAYTDKELEDMSQQLSDTLFVSVLGKNKDPENVMYDLDLPDRIEGYPFDVTWKSDNMLVLGSNGTINTDRLLKEDPDDEGLNVRLCATLKYKDYSEDKYSYVVLHKRLTGPGDIRKNLIEEAVTKVGKDSETLSVQNLPKEAGGEKITFYEKSPGRGLAVLFVGIVTAFFLAVSKDRKIRDEAAARRKQLEIDHPVILNQYMLYYMAGMNPRAIWYELCRRYEQEKGKNHGGRRYAYEEMTAARNRMEEGCSELAAYDGFAARCDDIRYRSFVNFVKQAVVTGGDGLGGILYEEMDKARRERVNRVKTAASEAETKLLLPMFMMLAVVLVIVMVPAFISLNG